MALPDWAVVEEQKALEYQRAEKRRVRFGRFLQAALKAPSGPAKQVKKNFEPLRRS